MRPNLYSAAMDLPPGELTLVLAPCISHLFVALCQKGTLRNGEASFDLLAYPTISMYACSRKCQAPAQAPSSKVLFLAHGLNLHQLFSHSPLLCIPRRSGKESTPCFISDQENVNSGLQFCSRCAYPHILKQLLGEFGTDISLVGGHQLPCGPFPSIGRGTVRGKAGGPF